ncbi:hypothetical protein FRUB_00659 [Fimbriiglobus ruber]|uniref:Uncharacterized protein n=1 Tax=Fimbriiglobus ruber TaxID=1908690 RepID=A0A225DZP1_9BACT|nr:hypothetical protein FRUB_00659 [Fimbriiglobus ruber]
MSQEDKSVSAFNYFEVRDALIKAGRADLIGGCEGLIEA